MKTITVVCFLVCLISTQADAIQKNLSQADIDAALAYGKKESKKAEEALHKSYCIGSCDFFSEHILIRTKWHKIARVASLSAEHNRKITPSEIQSIIEDNDLQIDVVVYGNSLNFADGYTLTMIQGNRVLVPSKLHADHFVEKRHGRRIEGFPTYHAVIRSYFPYDDLDLATPAKIILKKDSKECSYSIDFKQYK